MMTLRYEFALLTGLSLAHVLMNALDFQGALTLPRLVVSLIFLLVIPGYLLQSALFPRRDTLDAVERIALTLGLSIATVPPLTLILERVATLDLSHGPVLAAQMTAIIAFCPASYLRRGMLPPDERLSLHVGLPLRGWWDQQSVTDRRLYAILAVSLGVALSMVAVIMTAPSPAERLTEFYIVGREGLAEDFPRFIIPDEPLAFDLGIVNREGDEREYHIEVWADGQRLMRTDAIRLDDGQRWEDTVRVMPDATPAEQRLDFQLHNADGLYRQLQLWVEVGAS